MKTDIDIIETYGPEIRRFNEFISTLDPAVKAEAFKFLIGLRFRQGTVATEPKIDFVPAVLSPKADTKDERATSPQELLRAVGASSAAEKAVVLGYWLELLKGESSFSGTTLREVFDLAREPLPKNPSDMVAKLERSGRLMRVDKVAGTQYYRLTRTAVEQIETKLKEAEQS